MKCKDIIDIVEKVAPTDLAKSWDNVGLLVGDREKKIQTIMIALDPTGNVIRQGIDAGIDMLITHHPMIFSPLKSITYDDFIGRRIMDLIQNDIAYYAMHTNFDMTKMAEAAAKMICLSELQVLEPEEESTSNGIGRIGELERSMTLEECALVVKERFQADHVRIVGNRKKMVKKAGISPGSGKSMIDAALLNRVDVLITGDIDHHTAIDANEQGLCIIDGGHYGTEHIMVEYMERYLNESIEKLRNGEKIKIISAMEQSPFFVL